MAQRQLWKIWSLLKRWKMWQSRWQSPWKRLLKQFYFSARCPSHHSHCVEDFQSRALYVHNKLNSIRHDRGYYVLRYPCFVREWVCCPPSRGECPHCPGRTARGMLPRARTGWVLNTKAEEILFHRYKIFDQEILNHGRFGCSTATEVILALDLAQNVIFLDRVVETIETPALARATLSF